MPTNYRVNAKNIFFTYPQCPITKERLRDFLLEKGCTSYVVSRELHEDGSPHLHALGVWTVRKNITSAAAFDVDGYHPNFQTAKNLPNVYRYVIKCGDFIKNCDYSQKRKWGEIISDSTTKEDFISGVLETYPRDVALHLEKLQYFAEWKWGEVKEEYVSAYTEFKISEGMKTWCENNLFKVNKV